MFRLLILSLVLLPGLTGHAHAEPISLSIAAVQAFLATTIAGTTLTLGTALQLSLIAASVGFSLLGGGSKRQQAVDPGKAKNTFETADSAEIRAIGRVRIGGVKIFGNTNGANRMRLIAHCKGPIDGVETHYLGGREIIVEDDGAVSSPPYPSIGGSYVYIRRKPGDGTETAWPQLTSLFPSLWTADHRVRGIAQTLLQYISPGLAEKKFLKLYQNGAPDYECVMRAELLYDPRDGVTRWSDNAILGVLHIMLTFPGLTLADFDVAQIAAEATRADALVATRTGTEKRARIWGVWESEMARGDLLKQALVSVGAEIVPRPGDLIGIALVDDDRIGEVTLAEKHLVSLGLRYGPEGVERPNICRVKYYSPERNYELAEIDMTGIAWARIDDEVDRFGDQIVEYSLPFCPSAAQAQRLARRLFAIARGDSGVATTNMTGLSVWGARGVTIPFPDLDRAPVCLVSPPRVDDESGTVEVPYVVWPDLPAWNPESDEALPPPVIPELGYESTMTQPSAPTLATVVTYPDASKATRVAYVVPGDATLIEASLRVVTGPIPGSWQSMTEFVAPGGYAHAYGGDQTGQTIEFRIRGFNADEDGSLWSPTLTALIAVDNTAPDVPTLAVDVVVLGEYPEETRTATVSVTAPAILRVASLYIAGDDAPGTIPIKPGEVMSFESVLPPREDTAFTVTWTAQAKVSNGTGSSIASVSVVVPAIPV